LIKNYFKDLFCKIWQLSKKISIFATQNKNMLRIQLHIESVKGFSPRWDYTGRGACKAAE